MYRDLKSRFPDVIFTRLKLAKPELMAYSSKSNSFYQTLTDAGFTNELLIPDEHNRLADFRLGIIDIHQSKNPQIQQSFVENFKTQIIEIAPLVVCCNGKEVARILLQCATTKEIEFGFQQQQIHYTKIYVAPSTSFQASPKMDIDVWKALKNYIDTAKANDNKKQLDSFNITVNNNKLLIKEMNIENDASLFEVWDRGELQFVLAHYFHDSEISQWRIATQQSSNISEEYISAISIQIESHYE